MKLKDRLEWWWIVFLSIIAKICLWFIFVLIKIISPHLLEEKKGQ